MWDGGIKSAVSRTFILCLAAILKCNKMPAVTVTANKIDGKRGAVFKEYAGYR